MNAIIRFCLVFAVMTIIPSMADRSPYVPRPVDYPGLLSRFGEESSAPASTTTQRTTPLRPQSTGDDLGDRLGETAPPRLPARLPCVECYVYITRNGDMLRVNREDITPAGRGRGN